VRVLFQPDIA